MLVKLKSNPPDSQELEKTRAAKRFRTIQPPLALSLRRSPMQADSLPLYLVANNWCFETRLVLSSSMVDSFGSFLSLRSKLPSFLFAVVFACFRLWEHGMTIQYNKAPQPSEHFRRYKLQKFLHIHIFLPHVYMYIYTITVFLVFLPSYY